MSKAVPVLRVGIIAVAKQCAQIDRLGLSVCSSGNFASKLIKNQNDLRLAFAQDVADMFIGIGWINGCVCRSRLEDRKLGNDRLKTSWHEQSNDVTLSHARCGEEARNAGREPVKLRIGERSPIADNCGLVRI